MRRLLAHIGLAPLSALIAETARADELERALGDSDAMVKLLTESKPPQVGWLPVGVSDG